MKEFVKSEIDKIRRKSFPHVKRVFLFFRKGTDAYMSMYWLPFGMMIMEVDKSTFKMPKSAIRALIAHELAHYKHYFSERKADMKVLEIGMGKGLLKFHKYHNKRFEQYTEKEALTTKEIKQYLNENQTQPSRRL